MSEQQPLLDKAKERGRADLALSSSPPLWGSVGAENSINAGDRNIPDVLDRAPIEYQGSDAKHASLYQRTRYYSKLAPANKSNLLLAPRHVIPTNIFVIGLGTSQGGSQSSLITILSIWNTMMGTSVLTMPWAISEAGFTTGIAVVLLMALLTGYTCYLVLQGGEGGKLNGEDVEFADVVRYYLGERYYYVAVVFSVLTLFGASIVYWVLMTGFLYNVVDFAHDPHNNHDTTDADDPDAHWHVYWQSKWAAIYLVIIVFPLINFKSLTFFTKFNSLGVFSIAYILFFVVFNAAQPESKESPAGGFHMDHVTQFKGGFAALCGVLCLSYFIHNGILSIMRNNREPKNNVRDLSVAYLLVCLTYLLVGVTFFCTFKGDKDEILSNMLANFKKSDDTFIYALVAQIFLLFQMITVYPLLQFLIRFQVMSTFFGGVIWPSVWHVISLNAAITVVCVLVAMFYPEIGTIIRFTGAFCGLAYVFALPCLVKLEMDRRKGTLTLRSQIIHYGIIILGVANVAGQFAIKT